MPVGAHRPGHHVAEQARRHRDDDPAPEHAGSRAGAGPGRIPTTGDAVTAAAAATVLVVEDHALLAQSLALALQAEGHAVHLAELGPPEHLLAQARALQPDVVLLDLDLGPVAGAGEALVPALAPLARVVVVSGSGDALRLGTCLELGAAGVLPKTLPFPELLAAVTAAAEGRPVLRDTERQDVLARARAARHAQRQRREPFERLTAREAEVLHEVMQGAPAAEIAARAVVSEATVRTQIRAVLTKLGVTSQLAAVAEAHRVGWEGPTAPRG